MELQQFINSPPGSGCLPGHAFLFNRLVSKLASLNNVAIVAHRGWGKQLLLKETGYTLLERHKDFRVFYFDLKTVFELSDFLKGYAAELCRSTSSKLPARTDPAKDIRDILDLTETIAKVKKIKLIIFISNFQNTKHFVDSYQVLKRFRLCWRKHESCAYCLSGNNNQYFKKLFGVIGSPMYGFGRCYYPGRNTFHNYLPYIRSLFFNGNKIIEDNAAKTISMLAENHLFYLQLLSWNAYLITDRICTASIVEKAFENLVDQNEIHFENILGRINPRQFNFVRALLLHPGKICSAESLEKYGLGSSSNVARIRECLEIKGIIENHGHTASIIDPLFSHWLRKTCARSSKSQIP